MMILKSVFLFILIIFMYGSTFIEGKYDDYKNHECIRPCNNETAQMLCHYEWVVEWYSVLSYACLDCPMNKTHCDANNCIPSNGFPRSVLVVNRMLPGPSLTVCKGDILSIKVKNHLHFGEATTIHWHGIKQLKSPFMDGVNMITQCPIDAHTSFEYRFEADSDGTHFWHAHAGLQRSDGFFGPIIVHPYEEKNAQINEYDYDLQEHVIIVNDWLNNTSIEKFAGHHHNDGDNKPRAILINGKGILQTIWDDGQEYETPRAIFTVQKDMRYRFRMINAGILYCPIEISIDRHNLTIIGSDGNDVKPYEVESLIIMAGERYDFVVNANQELKNYWFRAKGFADCGNHKVFQTAILNYKGIDKYELPDGPLLNYDTMSREGKQLNPWNRFINSSNSDIFTSVDKLEPIIDADFYSDYIQMLSVNDSDIKRHYLSMEFNKINNPEFNDEMTYSLSDVISFDRPPLYTPQINNISLHTPGFPVLYDWDKVPKEKLCNENNRAACFANQTYCSCLYTYEFDLNDVVEFVIVDEGFTFQSNHPMHLHGHRYAVMGIDKLERSISMSEIKKMDKAGLLKRNLINPPLKDTTTVPVGGYTIIRFLTNNPGTWLFHCHLEFHSEIGMAFLIKVGTRDDIPAQPRNWPRCGSFEYTGSGSKSNVQISLFIPILLLFSQFLVIH